jgi:hypothetical protein|tara:strand:- start:586 stop:1515 length:930 start_codon:yes stop_codon:yes gene_type:complete
MAYESGGIISAADYNTLINGTNKLNTTWSTGTGDAGYGQTAITTKSAGDTVSATEWASVINKLNIVRTHQTGAGTGVVAVVTGDIVAYQLGVDDGVDLAYTNRLVFNAQGSTTTDSGTTHNPVDADGIATFTFTRTATFASADQARYFFNAGGELNLDLTAGANTGGTGRGAQALSMVTAVGGIADFRATTNNGRTGTGETETTNNLTIGYYDLTTSDQIISKVSESGAAYTPYTADFCQVAVKSNGTQGANGDKGTIITWTITLEAAATGAGGSFNDNIDVQFVSKVNVTAPETASGLSAVWGSVTIG